MMDDPKQEAPPNPPGAQSGPHRWASWSRGIGDKVETLEYRLEALNADYEVHRHGQEEISGLKERVRQLEDLIGRVDALERRMGP